MQGPIFVVHNALHVRVVLGLAPGSVLLSAPGGAGFWGHHGFLAVLRAGGWQQECAILDCGAAPGHALAALQTAMPMVVLAPCPAWSELAAAWPGRVLAARPEARDLAQWDARRGETWLRDWATP